MKQPIPREIQVVWDRGDKILAIKLLREARDLGLAEAKDLLESVSSGSQVSAPAVGSSLPPHVQAALTSGNKIEAIKLLREATGLGLKDAKDMVDAAQSTSQTPAATRLSPGEVPRSGSWLGVVLVAAAALALALWFFINGG